MIGNKLEQLRISRQLSRAELAELSKVTHTEIINIEMGRNKPTARILSKLITALQLTDEEKDELFEEV